MENETIKVSDIKKFISQAHATLSIVLHALETRTLIGIINQPGTPVEKKPRKRRTKKEIALNATAGHIKMDLEKEYQAERQEPLNLPDGDKNSTFYGKKKREKKVIVPMVDK